MQTYDLIVIGSGPAGQRAAIQGAKSGNRVAVVEQREIVGGVCINTGTIPSKTMREAVLHLSGYQYQGIYGINYRVKEKITMADLAFRVQHVIKTEIDVTQAQLSRNGIEVLTGTRQFPRFHPRPRREFARPGRSRSAHHHHRHRHQAGRSPKVPLNGRNIINSDQILDMPEIPQDPDRGGRRRHRRRVHLHVRHPGRPRDPGRKAPAPARIRRCRNGGGALLSPARPPRHHAPERRSGERGGERPTAAWWRT